MLETFNYSATQRDDSCPRWCISHIFVTIWIEQHFTFWPLC